MSSEIELGKYIVFEGGEHVGKSTQVSILANAIRAELVREPGGTLTGEKIRAILLDPHIESSPKTELLLHAAQRAELMTSVVNPLLKGGKHVVSDRSWVSSGAYQAAQGVDIEEIMTINEVAIGERMYPDLLILLDADPEAIASRGGTDKDYYERMDSDFHHTVRRNFISLGRELGAVVIDATANQDYVAAQVREAVSERLEI